MDDKPSRVVVLVGRGNLGARMFRALSGDSAIEVLVAGRRAGAVFAIYWLMVAKPLAVG